MIAVAKIVRKDGGVDDVPVYSVGEFLDTFNADAALSRIVYSCKNSRSTKAVEYINIPCAFDTEWSTVPMPEDPDKYFSVMYVWSFCLGYRVVAGRTWEEFETLLRELKLRLLLHFNRILRIYVHNLSAEWQFLHYRLPTKKLFSREVRQPIEWKLAGQYEGIEFRCSYILTNNSLVSWAADEPLCPYGKQVGELDYSIIRTRSTPLTEHEWGYIAADVLTMNYCIAAMIGREWRRGIDSLPLTKTGFVRRAMRRKFAKIPEWQRYEQRVRLTAEQFILYYQGLRGGDTHSQIVNTGVVWPDVWSFDITSSYPYQMIAREFPASAAVYLEKPSISDFNVVLSEPGWLWIAKMRLVDLRLKDPTYYATVPLSLSTAHDPGGKKNPDGTPYKYKRGEKREIIGDELRLDNGRIVYAKEVEIPLYSTDFWIMNENYTFKVKEITDMLFHPKKALLPKCFRDFILDLYQKKTMLKGVTDDEQPGAENLYRLSKENINSAFG